MVTPHSRVVLITGPEALLAERAVAECQLAAAAQSPDAETVHVVAAELTAGRLAELVGGSLFATQTVAVIHDVGGLPTDLGPALLALATDPPPELALVLVHGAGTKGRGLVDKLRKAATDVVQCPTPKTWELPKFVEQEVRRLGGRLEPRAGQALVDSVGSNLRAVAAAVDQLVADADGAPISADLVRRYFGGRAEVTGFAVADAALAGQTGQAAEQLRWALSTGVAPVLLTSALAAGLRGLGRLLCVRGGAMSDNEVAGLVGVPPWKLKSMRQQARGWDQRGVAAALRAVATADADIKGGAVDAEYALERCVLAVTRARQN